MREKSPEARGTANCCSVSVGRAEGRKLLFDVLFKENEKYPELGTQSILVSPGGGARSMLDYGCWCQRENNDSDDTFRPMTMIPGKSPILVLPKLGGNTSQNY